jgi:hypothetical protein
MLVPAPPRRGRERHSRKRAGDGAAQARSGGGTHVTTGCALGDHSDLGDAGRNAEVLWEPKAPEHDVGRQRWANLAWAWP